MTDVSTAGEQPPPDRARVGDENSYSPNFDWEERVKAAVGSLRELIIIFTGITITASFTLFIARHLKPLSEASHSSVILTTDGDLPAEAGLLLLLLLCVMRFYYGNVMILDRYYLLPGTLREHERRFGLDSLFIVLMTFGLAILGLVVQFPPLFFWVYGCITLLSVAWLGMNLNSIFLERNPNRANVNPRWQEEARTQVRWLLINLAFLLVFIVVLAAGGRQTVVSTRGTETVFSLSMSSWIFRILLATAFLNSILDFVLNRKEYFPKYREGDAARGRSRP